MAFCCAPRAPSGVPLTPSPPSSSAEQLFQPWLDAPFTTADLLDLAVSSTGGALSVEAPAPPKDNSTNFRRGTC